MDRLNTVGICMARFLQTIFFILFLLTNAVAITDINVYTDSLKFEKQDSNKVNRLNNIARYYYEFDLDKSLDYVNQAYLLSKNLEYKKGQARALDLKSNIFEEIGEFNKALEFKFQAIDIYKKLNYKIGLCRALNNLGVVFFNHGNYAKAIESYTEAYEMAKKYDYVDMKATCLLNIGEAYLMQNKLNQAMDYEEKSLKISLENNYVAETGFAKGIMGQVYLKKGLYILAGKEIKEAMNYFFMSNENSAIAEYNIQMARVHVGLDNLDSAISCLKQSILISDLLNAKMWKLKAYKELADVYAKKNNIESAYKYQKLVNQLNDTIYNEANARKAAQMQIIYETEKKETQIKLLTKENEAREVELSAQKKLSIVFTFAIVTISFLAFGLLYINRKKAKINAQLTLTNQEISAQKDELNLLNHEINTINEQLEKSLALLEIEKGKSDVLLLNILPEAIAGELKAKGKVQPKFYGDASILFADFVNFTEFALKNSPTSIVEQLDDFFNKFDDICEKHNLEKIKTIGDCYMAAGGVPLPNPNHAVAAALAAMEMLTYVQSKGWKIRIGIHSGPIVAGVIGKKKFAYDIWGDSVNIASRIETAGATNQINISQPIYESISHAFHCSYRGKITTKNRGDIDMYFIESKID